MESQISYKFRSSKYLNRLRFTGTHISVQDVVDWLYKKYQLDDYNTSLQIRNLHNKRVYTDPNEMLMRNAGIEVIRMPGHGNKSLRRLTR